MTLDRLSEMAASDAASTTDARRMMAGKYGLKAVRYIGAREIAHPAGGAPLTKKRAPGARTPGAQCRTLGGANIGFSIHALGARPPTTLPHIAPGGNS